MPMYMTFLKVDRTKTHDCLRHLKDLPEKPNAGINVWYVANVFGDWDNCVWYETNDNTYAIDWVQHQLANIPGVVQTYTLPTTPIKEYYKHWNK